MTKGNDVGTDVLLTEYEVCMNDASQLDSDIWQSGSIFIGVSMLGFTVLLQFQAHNWAEFLVFAITGIFGLALIVIWDKLNAGWLRLIHINFYRMREIEKEMGMWKERYILNLNNPESSNLDSEIEKERIEQIEKVILKAKKLGPSTVRKTLIYVRYLIAFGWISLVLKQAIFLIFIGG